MISKGIDISSWDKGLYLSQLSNDIKWIIIRASYSAPTVVQSKYNTDPCFEDFYKQAVSKGLNIGIYQYSEARNTEQAIEEANWLLSIIDKHNMINMPIYYDIEGKVLSELDKYTLTDIYCAWYDVVRHAGYQCGLYTGASAFTNNFDLNNQVLRNSWLWIAHYNNNEEIGETYLTRLKKVNLEYHIHQYASDVSMQGHSIDGNYLLRERSDKMKNYIDRVKEVASTMLGMTNEQAGYIKNGCTNSIQNCCLEPCFDNTFYCPTGWPTDWLDGKNKEISKYFDIYTSGTIKLKYGDIVVWSKYNQYGHSAICVQDNFELNIDRSKKYDDTYIKSFKCLTGNVSASTHGGDVSDHNDIISITNHHVWGIAGVLTPKTMFNLDSVTSKNGAVTFKGWCFSYRNVEDSINVAVYTSNNKYFIGNIQANLESNDVNDIYNITGKHRFSATFSTNLEGEQNIHFAIMDNNVNAHWTDSQKITIKPAPKVGDTITFKKCYTSVWGNDENVKANTTLKGTVLAIDNKKDFDNYKACNYIVDNVSTVVFVNLNDID